MTLTPYEQQLQRSLDLICYRDATRDYLSSSDEDVLQIFSGDVNLARKYLKIFHGRHQDKTWVITDNGIYQVKVTGLFTSAEQKSQRSAFKANQKRKRNRGRRY